MFRQRGAILRELQVQMSVSNNTLILVAQSTVSNWKTFNKQKVSEIVKTQSEIKVLFIHQLTHWRVVF
jgi:hypothetical protein